MVKYYYCFFQIEYVWERVVHLVYRAYLSCELLSICMCVFPRLVVNVGSGICLYKFPIIAFLLTLE